MHRGTGDAEDAAHRSYFVAKDSITDRGCPDGHCAGGCGTAIHGGTSMTINTTCGKIAKHLAQSENTILSDEDIRTATKHAGILSKGGQDNYLGEGGYLAELSYIKRCGGGWILTRESQETGTITLIVSSMNFDDVSAAIGKAIKPFDNIVEVVE